jgi:hypothetical protein
VQLAAVALGQRAELGLSRRHAQHQSTRPPAP